MNISICSFSMTPPNSPWPKPQPALISSTKSTDTHIFNGAYIYTGAARSVIVTPTPKPISGNPNSFLNFSRQLCVSNLASISKICDGNINIRIPVAKFCLGLSMHVVPAYLPLLICLYLIDKFQLIVYTPSPVTVLQTSHDLVTLP